MPGDSIETKLKKRKAFLLYPDDKLRKAWDLIWTIMLLI